jgi:hypothetical protein
MRLILYLVPIVVDLGIMNPSETIFLQNMTIRLMGRLLLLKTKGKIVLFSKPGSGKRNIMLWFHC